MLSKNDIKNIKSLEQKKFRDEKRLFVAEGHKLVDELLSVFDCVLVAGTERWMARNPYLHADRLETVTPDELKRASLLRSPQDVIAVFHIPEYDTTIGAVALNNLVLALDEVQDPGNLGTIVRIADWFGIKDIFCSRGTADIYNPKAIQATMGAVSRVKIHYVDLVKELSSLPASVPVYGTFLNGDIIYDSKLSESGVIIMGNEGNGISKETEKTVNRRLYIPNWPKGAFTSESLNVAIATSIVCSEFRRRQRI